MVFSKVTILLLFAVVLSFFVGVRLQKSELKSFGFESSAEREEGYESLGRYVNKPNSGTSGKAKPIFFRKSVLIPDNIYSVVQNEKFIDLVREDSLSRQNHLRSKLLKPLHSDSVHTRDQKSVEWRMNIDSMFEQEKSVLKANNVCENTKQLVIQVNERVFTSKDSEQLKIKIERLLNVELSRHFYVPDNSYIVLKNMKQVAEMYKKNYDQIKDLVHFVGYYSPEWKTTYNLPNPPNIHLTRRDAYRSHDTQLNLLKGFEHVEGKIMFYITLVNHNSFQMFNIWKKQLHALFQWKFPVDAARTVSLESVLEFEEYDSFLTMEKTGKEMRVMVPTEFAHETLEFFKSKEVVHFVDIQPKLTTMNYDGSSFGQSGDRDQFPFYDAGITGKGEIVGVGDSGLDYDNCYFDDDTQSVLVSDDTSKGNLNHRKVIAVHRYKSSRYGLSDGYDAVNGHGTHVAGTIVSELLEKKASVSDRAALNKEKGVAYGARVVFYGFAYQSLSGLLTPGNVEQTTFQSAYNLGARVHSNSWGTAMPYSCQYDCKCKQYNKDITDAQCIRLNGRKCCEANNEYNSRTSTFDKYMYGNQENLLVFAAGNDGSMSKDKSIGTPGSAKNLVLVGSSNTNAEGWKDAVVYTDRSNFVKSYNFKNTAECCADRFAKANCCFDEIKKRITPDHKYNNESLSYFSSRGPVVGNRIKPDVVAIGQLVPSARSDGVISSTNNGCTNEILSDLSTEGVIYSTQGTSMATPTVSGLALLARQYFKEGWYKTGEKNENAGLDISAPLLKAVLINSGNPLKGSVMPGGSSPISIDKSDVGYPNKYYGHGAVNLLNTLKLKKHQSVHFNTIPFDRMNISTGVESTFSFVALSNVTSIRATLCYFDTENLASTTPGLNINLDMTIEINNKVYYPNGLNQVDTLNPVESIRISDIAKNTIITVKIKNAKSIVPNVKYSLLVSGEVKDSRDVDKSPSFVLSESSNLTSNYLLLVILIVAFVF